MGLPFRRSLLKKESPELLPLLQDFQEKINALLPLLALFKPSAKARLPSSGASYLQARVSLLLNHLANLSFYIMMKAEGAEVRSHPVVSQLVWLRELDELMKSVDERVGVKLRKAIKQATKLRDEGIWQLEAPKNPEVSSEAKPATPQEAPKLNLSLAERLARLRGKTGNGSGSEPERRREQAEPREPLVSSLLRLPAKRRSSGPAAEGPADLDEIDPTLGAWIPSASVSQQLSEVQQHLRERRAKAAPQASDANPEPRARAHRERVRTEIDPRDDGELPAKETLQHARLGGDQDDLGEVVQEANAKARARKERKAAEASAKMKAKVAQQYHPEKTVEAGSCDAGSCLWMCQQTCLCKGRRATNKQILENRGLVRHRGLECKTCFQALRFCETRVKQR